MKRVVCVTVAVLLILGCRTPDLDLFWGSGDGYGGGVPEPPTSVGSPVDPTAASSSSASSSSSTCPCAPNRSLCKVECGEAPDTCGGIISCGCCKPGQSCTAEGKCCDPATIEECVARFPPGTCGPQPDGCGGFVMCDTVCGLNDGFLTCKADGKCHCVDASTQAGYPQALSACKLSGHKYPAYCRANTAETYLDRPKDCHRYSQQVDGVPYDLFCCDTPQ